MTEDKIMEFLRNRPNGVTAEEVAIEVGISTVSARRYFKLLQEKQILHYDLSYGKQGRPTYIR